MIKSRTKIEAVISIAIITLLILPSIIGDVTITDTAIIDDTFGTIVSFDNDYIDISNLTISNNASIGNIFLSEPSGTTPGYWNGSNQYIMNENTGETYVATGANLITAVNTASNGDVLKIPKANISLTDDLHVYCKIVGIDSNTHGSATPFNYSSVINVTNNYTINIYEGGKLESIGVVAPSTHGGEAIHIWGDNIYYGNIILNDVTVYKPQHINGTGINISAVSTGAGTNAIGNCDFVHVDVMGFNKSLVLYSDELAGGGAHLNNNNFYSCCFKDTYLAIEMESNNGQIQGNNFYGTGIQTETYTDYCVVLKGDDTRRNNFYGLIIWDVVSNGVIYAVNISDVNCDDNSFYGSLTTGNMAHVYDAGNDNLKVFDGIFIIEDQVNISNDGIIYGDAGLQDTSSNYIGVTNDNGVAGFQMVGYRDSQYSILQNKFYASRGTEETPLVLQGNDECYKDIIYGYNGSAFIEAGRSFLVINGSYAGGDNLGSIWVFRVPDVVDGDTEQFTFTADNSKTQGSLLAVSGEITHYGSTDISDERVKEFISILSFEKAKDFVSATDFWSFYWKNHEVANETHGLLIDETSDDMDMGISAQHLYEIATETLGKGYAKILVNRGNEDKLWSINYERVLMVYGQCLKGVIREQDNQQAFLESIGYNPDVDYT